MEKLDLENVRIYSNTKYDIMDAMDLIGQKVYMSDDENFNDYVTCRLTGVQYSEDDDFPFLGKDENGIFSYLYFILVKDAKFKEENSGVKMNRPLDLSRVKVYTNTKEDAIKALSLIGEDVYMANADDFGIYTQGKLIGVRYADDCAYTDCPYLCGNMLGVHYKHIILCKDAKFKDEKVEYYPIPITVKRKDGLCVGDTFWIRSKDNTEVTHLVTITEITMDSKGSIASIGVGPHVLPPEELLKNYEWSNKSPKENDWRPFGISLFF